MFLDAAERAFGMNAEFPSLEELVTLPKPKGFGLVTATPTQRAVMCLLDGRPVPDHLWAVPEVRATFGDVRPEVCDEFMCLSGVRGAKTTMGVAAAICMTQRVSFPSDLMAGEMPRVNFVSERMDLVKGALRLLKESAREIPAIQAILYEQPLDSSDYIILRHPSGVPIEIKVVAASREGVTLVSRWCAGMLFDEAPRMASNEDSVKGIEEMLSAVRSRMLPGARIMYIGSPVGRIGPMYKMFTQWFGKPDAPVTVARAKGPWLNPIWWTPERIEALKKKDFDSYLNDVEAEFRDVEQSFFSSIAVDSAVRQAPLVLAPEPGKSYTAVIDPATRRNAWTLGIAETEDNVRFRVCLAMQWMGSNTEPLSPNKVFAEMKPTLERYGVSTVISDQYAADAMKDIALTHGIGLTSITITPKLKIAMNQSLKVRLDAGLMELPPEPQLRDDLVNVRVRVDKHGDPKIILPETSDGRHCDYAAMLALLCGAYIEESVILDVVKKIEEMTFDAEDEERPREWFDDDRLCDAAGW